MGMSRKIVGVLCGSRSDLGHVQKVTGVLKDRGWVYFPWDSEPSGERSYTVNAGSVHRLHDRTLEDVVRLSTYAKNESDKLIFVTCIGLNDDASGTIASYTGRRVVALPPDIKVYGRYPNGVRVYPFSTEGRGEDIQRALDYLSDEFDNPYWVFDDEISRKYWEEARKNLLDFREEIKARKIDF